ncbi:MAG: zf-HC2 domain-containing protein [Planctomycetota bacterium]|jgi:predicted anti-sigma-YlaC factor YlaD
MRPEIAQRCDAFYRVLSDYVDGELAEVDMAYVEEHLKLCPPCEVFLDQFRAVAEAARREKAAEMPEGVRNVLESVLSRWKAEQD